MEKKKQHYLLPCKGQKHYWGGGKGVWIFSGSTHWLRSHLSFLYHSKQQFTMVNGFFNVASFSLFTMVNTV